jgi:uncharacterized phage-associated protein
MSYSPALIANYFLAKAKQEGRALTPMQLLKLVYIAHGWFLGYFKKPLICERVQAWRYGPVIKSLYDGLKHYGSGAVRAPLPISSLPWQKENALDIETQGLLDSVWNSYSRFSGVQLSTMTHQQGTPWYQAWHEQGGHSQYFAPIDDSLIRRHYEQKIAEMQVRRGATA